MWEVATYSMETLDEGAAHVPGGTERAAWDFIALLRTPHNVKLTTCLSTDFSIEHFWTAAGPGSP